MGTHPLLLLILLLLPFSSSFIIVPYMQLDYAHFFRLAQCQSKCSQKYGHVSFRRLNDGSSIEEWRNDSKEMIQCSLGCDQPRRGRTRSPVPIEILDGSTFWEESSASTDKASPSSPVSRVSLLCQNIGRGLTDSIEGTIGIDIPKKHIGPLRFLIQWKYRQLSNGILVDEGPAITSSIESSPLIKVEGMMPGMQYKFIVTAIGPGGRLGEPISSEWFEAVHTEKNPEGAITVKSGHSIDGGITALIGWSRGHIDSCQYIVQFRNATHLEKKKIEIDSSSGIFFDHLEMDSEYEVSVYSSDLSWTPFPHPLLHPFTTPSCSHLYGKGSLQCPPEPVDNLVVSIRPNGSAIVSWKASAESSQVLTYEVLAQPISPCPSSPSGPIFLNAATSSAHLYLGDNRPCEFSIRVTNYDLVGRDASRETRVLLSPHSTLLSGSWEGVLAAGLSLVVLLVFLVLFKCCHSCLQKKSQHEDNKKSLVGYV